MATEYKKLLSLYIRLDSAILDIVALMKDWEDYKNDIQMDHSRGT